MRKTKFNKHAQTVWIESGGANIKIIIISTVLM